VAQRIRQWFVASHRRVSAIPARTPSGPRHAARLRCDQRHRFYAEAITDSRERDAPRRKPMVNRDLRLVRVALQRATHARQRPAAIAGRPAPGMRASRAASEKVVVLGEPPCGRIGLGLEFFNGLAPCHEEGSREKRRSADE
jgi:hypothetical protein